MLYFSISGMIFLSVDYEMFYGMAGIFRKIQIWSDHIISKEIPAYIVKTNVCGDFCEKLYRRAGDRDRPVYYREQRDCAAGSETVRNQQIYGTYRSDNIERFVWMVR